MRSFYTSTNMASMDCSICCQPFNRSMRKQIECEYANCRFSACKGCLRQYILSKELQPHCMQCKQNLSVEFILRHLNRCFMEGDYKRHRTSKLLERAMSQLPEAMPEVIRTQNILKKRLDCEEAEQALKEAVRVLRQHKDELRDLQQTVASKERRKFIMACSRESCRGFLTDKPKHLSYYQCGLCDYYTCSMCLCVRGADTETEHTCDPEHVASAECIRLQTRPCPACGERISKIDGCDQMWCVTCHTAFSWTRGTIENGVVHNPHYFQYQQTHPTPNVPMRQVGLGPCNPYALPDYQLIRPFEARLRRIAQPLSDRLLSMYQTIAHIHHYERLNIQRRMNTLDDDTQLKVWYLMGKVTKEQLATDLYSYDYNCMKERMILNVMDVLNDVGIETLWGLVNANEHEGIEAYLYKEYESFLLLCEYCNTQWLTISLTFRISVPWISIKKEGNSNAYVGLLLMVYRKKNVYKEFFDRNPHALKLEMGSLEMDTRMESFASIPRH